MILIVMKSLVLLMLVFGTVAADAEEKRLDDIKESLQTKINDAAPTDNFAKVLLDIDVEDIFKVLEQLPLKDRKKLCELMPPRRIVEYFERLPVEDRDIVPACHSVLIGHEERAGKLDEFLQTLTAKERVELNNYFTKTSILELYWHLPIPNNDFSFLGKHPEEIKKTLFDRDENNHLFIDLLELPFDQQLEMCKGFTLEKLSNVLKNSECPLRDDYDIGTMIIIMLNVISTEDNDFIEETEDGDLEESQGDHSPGDVEENGYEEPLFKQIIEIQLGKSKGIKVEQTPKNTKISDQLDTIVS